MTAGLPASFRPARRYGRRGLPAELVAAMWADYQRTRSLGRTAAKFGRCASTLGEMLARHGYRPRSRPTRTRAKGPDGRFSPGPAVSDAEIIAVAGTLRRVMLPPLIRHAWRHWPEAKRRWFVGLVQQRVDALYPDRRPPAGPLSANVEPFDYFSGRARALAAIEDTGRDSRRSKAKLKPASRGVIWRDRLFYWVPKTGYCSGPAPRRQLHRLIWAEAHGPVPAGHALRFRDGNPNNLTLANLRLTTRNELARENQSAHLQRRSRQLTSLLFNRSQKEKESHAHDELERQILTARRPARQPGRRRA